MLFIVIPGIPNSQVILCSWALPAQKLFSCDEVSTVAGVPTGLGGGPVS